MIVLDGVDSTGHAPGTRIGWAFHTGRVKTSTTCSDNVPSSNIVSLVGLNVHFEEHASIQ
jgi:hypothetical protein